MASSPQKMGCSEEHTITLSNPNQVQYHAVDSLLTAPTEVNDWNTSCSKSVLPRTNMELERNDFASDNSSSDIAEDNKQLENYEMHEFCYGGHGRRCLRTCVSQGEEDYRRLSSRLKKKTAFFGVSALEQMKMEKYDSSPGQPRKDIRSKTAQRKINIANSKLRHHYQRHHRRAATTIGAATTIVPYLAERDKGSVLHHDTSNKEVGESVSTDVAMVVRTLNLEKFKETYCIGRLVWGKLPQYDWWPGYIISYGEKPRDKREPNDKQETDQSDSIQVCIKWFGENQLSMVPSDKVTLFDEFEKYYVPLHMKGGYKKAILAVLKEAAKRCKMTFVSDPNDKKLHWVVNESSSQVTLLGEKSNPDPQSSISKGPEVKKCGDESSGGGSSEESVIGEEENTVGENNRTKMAEVRKRKKRKRKRMGMIILTSYDEEMVAWALKGFLPMGSKGLLPTREDQMQLVSVVSVEGGEDGVDLPKKKAKVIMEPVQKKVHFESVWEGELELSEICIGCGDPKITSIHPLFHGSYCTPCKDLFMECAYLFGEDGSQMYCCICSGGEKVFICDADNCSKVYCEQCLNKLCRQEEVERVDAADHWLCYMCCPTQNCVGLLAKREDWDMQLHQLFLNDNKMEFASPLIRPPIPPELQKPLRVLGLFDGNGVGLLILEQLGMEVELYVSSEADKDSGHYIKATHVGDIFNLTDKEVRGKGPFDLVLGGRPCNDLSVVSPARTGINDGIGSLFFNFFRILSIAKPAQNEDRPFFWLFGNVVSMRQQDKEDISRFLQCNPMVVDAKEISPTHRACYFWSNLPGMNRPVNPWQSSDRLNLQDCQETNCFRVAQSTKLRTIPTKIRPIEQSKDVEYPVTVKEQENEDWCAEMERLFIFPDCDVDVDLKSSDCQQSPGKTWNMRVIRHLLGPLKDYFMSSKNEDPNGDKPPWSPEGLLHVQQK